MRLAGLLAVLSGCNPAVPAATPTMLPTPTPLTRNGDWTPVIEQVDGVAMVALPPGCFMMGNAEGRRDERPVVEVCLRGFWLDRTEVTNAAYGEEGIFGGAERPRTNLTWLEARDFCARRGARLPSEAEWEYAGRGPEGWLYPWGNELLAERLVFDQNSNNETAVVGSRPEGASWVGALDMAGNAWEWVNSQYARYPFDAGDGRESLDESSGQRVYRGGVHSYLDYGAALTTRFRAAADSRDWFIGFRCARDAAT